MKMVNQNQQHQWATAWLVLQTRPACPQLNACSVPLSDWPLSLEATSELKCGTARVDTQTARFQLRNYRNRNVTRVL